MQKILVFAAHPDDEILGLGGTIRRLANEGKEIHAVVLAEGLTSRKDNRVDTDKSEVLKLQENAKKAAKIVGYTSIDFCELPDNRMDSIDLLDIIKIVARFVDKYEPDTIFTHHHGDLNIDHRRTCEAVLTACRPLNGNKVKRIYGFETPSSTEWNYSYENPFTPNVFFDVTDTLEVKVRGMSCYQTESSTYPHPRSPEALRALGKYRGSNVGFGMAEAFILLRELI